MRQSAVGLLAFAMCIATARHASAQAAAPSAPRAAPPSARPLSASAPKGPQAALHAARRGDTLFVHFAGSLAGARALLLERQAGTAWRIIGDTVVPPASIDELRRRAGARYDYLARLFDAENDRLLWLRLQTDGFSAGVASLLDADLGAALGRRFVDPRAAAAPARYRVRVLGVRPLAFEIAAPAAAERLVVTASPAVSHVPTALTVRWRHPAGSTALAYQVEGRSSDDTTWRRLSTRPIARPARGDSISTLIQMVREGVIWHLAVRPVGAGGGTGALSPVTRYEAFDRTPPRPVLDPRGTIDSANVVTLRWSAAPEPDAAGYLVYRSRDGKQKGARITATPIPVERLTWSDSSLEVSGPYVYRLAVIDSSRNESGPGNAAPVSVPDRTPPELRGALAVTVLGDSAVRLRWNRTRAGDLREYVLSRQRGDKFAGESWARLTQVLHRDSSFTDRGVAGSGLRGARVLKYRVVAMDSTGNASAPLEATVTVPDLRPPQAAAWMNADRAEGRAIVSWGVSPSDDVARYELRRATAVGDSLVATIPAGTRSAFDDFTAGANARRYTLIARDSAGNASPPRTATLETDAGPPLLAPANVMAFTRTAGVAVRWDPVTDAASYRIERAARRNGEFAVVGTSATPAFIDPAGRAGQWYRVVALDAARRAGTTSAQAEATAR